MKQATTVILTEKERAALSKFLMLKSKSEFPKQDTEQFSRIVNMLSHPKKKEFTVVEFNKIFSEVSRAVRLILKKQSDCLKIMENAGNKIVAAKYLRNNKSIGR